MRELFVDVEGAEAGDVSLHVEVCGREGGRGGGLGVGRGWGKRKVWGGGGFVWGLWLLLLLLLLLDF